MSSTTDPNVDSISSGITNLSCDSSSNVSTYLSPQNSASVIDNLPVVDNPLWNQTPVDNTSPVIDNTRPDSTDLPVPDEVESAAKVLIEEGLVLTNIIQFHIHVGHTREKLEVIRKLYSHLSSNKSIVFVNSITTSEEVRALLLKTGHTVSSFHSRLAPQVRDSEFELFRKGDHKVLIATDVLARGVDISNIGVIINFDVPTTKVDNFNFIGSSVQYIHRIGRCGRFGIKGVVINLVSSEDQIKFHKICSDLLPHCNGQNPFHLKSQSEEDIQSIIDEIESRASSLASQARHLHSGLTFENLGEAEGQRLIEPLVQFVQEELQLMEPSEVQAKAIPRLLVGQNLIVQAHTGSGKSLAFVVSMFQSIDPSLKVPQALIIAPTREIALITHQKWVRPFVNLTLDPANPEGELSSITAVKTPEGQDLILKNQVIINHIIVGTPGTIKGWMDRRNVLPGTINFVVLDEADELCKEGGLFQQTKAILQNIIRNRPPSAPSPQISCFSATFEPSALKQCYSLVTTHSPNRPCEYLRCIGGADPGLSDLFQSLKSGGGGGGVGK